MSDSTATLERPPKTKATPGTRAAPGKMTAKQRAASEADRYQARVRDVCNLFKQASDPTRMQIVLMLAEGEVHVGALCGRLGQSQPAVSHHLALMRHASIIYPRRQGKNNFYSLTDKGRDLAAHAARAMED